MSGWRNWLAFVALLVLVSACALSVREAATRPVRLVDRLDHEALFNWLCNRDLGRELSSIKLRLARRLAEDFRQGYDWPYELAQLDPTRRERAIANLRELVPVWLLDRADRYTSLAEPERTTFVDEQLDDLLYWPVWRHGTAGQFADLLPRNAALAEQQIDDWTDGLETSQRQRIQQFTGALRLRWLQRGYLFLPGGA